MLKWIEYSCFEEKRERLNNLPQNGIYIVPDIKSKLKFQNILFQKEAVLTESRIQRATDFYCSVFMKIFPNYHMITSHHLDFLFQTWRKKNPSKYPNTDLKHISILHYLASFLPILSHPEGPELFKNWITRFPSGYKYKKNYEMTLNFWLELQKSEMMEKSCAKYSLLAQDLKNVVTGPLTVDLGFSLDYTESEIYKLISHHQDVTLLVPSSLQSPIFPQSHIVYNQLQPKQKHQAQNLSKQTQNIQAYKFSNKLEEVRFVTEHVRKGLEKGLPPEDITVLAPNIEDYWTCLKSYFQVEGIPVQKETTISYSTFPQVQKWLSSVRLHLGQIQFSNLEDTISYQNLSDTPLDKIKSTYYHCDRPQDLKNLNLKFIEKKELSLNEFLEIIISLWKPIIQTYPNKELDTELGNILTELMHPLTQIENIKASKSQWIKILEQHIASKDKLLPSEISQGVSCVSLNAITSVHGKQIHIIGLDHQSCYKHYSSIFNEWDAQKILEDLGFLCFQLDSNQNEYELTHFLKSLKQPCTLSYSQTHWNQQIAQPSRVWNLHYNKDTAQEPHTVWDSLKKQQSLEKIIQNTKHSIKDIQHSLHLSSDSYQSFQSSLDHLSPSRIKKYISCPFIFLSEDIFKLSQKPLKDIDLNPMNKGNIIHTLFEEIVKQNISTEDEIKNLIHSIKNQFDVMDETIFQFYLEELLSQALLFLEQEKLNQEKVPGIKNIGTEVEFEGFWNFSENRLDKKGDIKIKGKIDRIDICKDHILIMDYKASSSAIQTLANWNKDEIECQMPLYVQAVENKLTSIDSSATPIVAGALYVIYKNFEYKGFTLKDSPLSPILKKRSYSLVEEKKKEEVLMKVNQSLQDKIQNIQKGKFYPQPVKLEKCQKCHWSRICRAPHLN